MSMVAMKKWLTPRTLSVLLFPIYIGLLLIHSWYLYGTLIGKGGIAGHSYIFYNLSKIQFEIYNAVIVSMAVGLIILHSMLLTGKKMAKNIWLKSIFAVLLLITLAIRIYMVIRYTGKG